MQGDWYGFECRSPHYEGKGSEVDVLLSDEGLRGTIRLRVRDPVKNRRRAALLVAVQAGCSIVALHFLYHC
mgnify:FL=1